MAKGVCCSSNTVCTQDTRRTSVAQQCNAAQHKKTDIEAWTQESNISTHTNKREQRKKKTHDGANTRLESSSREEEQNRTRDDATSRQWKEQDGEIIRVKEQNNIRAKEQTRGKSIGHSGGGTGPWESGGIERIALLTEQQNRSASRVTRPQAKERGRED